MRRWPISLGLGLRMREARVRPRPSPYAEWSTWCVRYSPPSKVKSWVASALPTLSSLGDTWQVRPLLTTLEARLRHVLHRLLEHARLDFEADPTKSAVLEPVSE